MAITDNLISHWKLDESSGNAADSAGSNTLTNNGTVTYGAGALNNAANNMQSGKYLSITDGSQSGLDLTSDFTFSMWLMPNTLSSGSSYTLISKGNIIVSEAYLIYYTNQSGTYKMDFRISSDGTSAADDQITLSGALSTVAWSHLVFTYKASTHTVECYVNGTSVGTASTNTPTSIANCNADFRLGGGYNFNNTGPYDPYVGKMDEVTVWSRVITSAEVTTLYNSGTPLAYPFSGGGSTFTPLIIMS